MKDAWAVLAAREGWEKLPKYALGVSSGASMVRSCSLPADIPSASCDNTDLISAEKLMTMPSPTECHI